MAMELLFESLPVDIPLYKMCQDLTEEQGEYIKFGIHNSSNHKVSGCFSVVLKRQIIYNNKRMKALVITTITISIIIPIEHSVMGDNY